VASGSPLVQSFTRFIEPGARTVERELGDSSPSHHLPHARAVRHRVPLPPAWCTIAISTNTTSWIAAVNETAGTTMNIAVGGQDRNYVKEALDEPDQAIKRLDDALLIEGRRAPAFARNQISFFQQPKMARAPESLGTAHGTLFHIHSAREPGTTVGLPKRRAGNDWKWSAEASAFWTARQCSRTRVNCGPRRGDSGRAPAPDRAHPLANTISRARACPGNRHARGGGHGGHFDPMGRARETNQNILAAARLAAQYQKALNQDATPCLASQQVARDDHECAGEEFLHHGPGRAGAWQAADWTLLSLKTPNLTPTRLDNLMENIIWRADGSEDRYGGRARPRAKREWSDSAL